MIAFDIYSQLITYGYIFIFLLMFIEGPITTFSAAFLASQGIFNIYIIFILAVLGNVIPDGILFLIGRFSRKTFILRIVNKFKIDKTKLDSFKRNLDKHLGKSIIMLKLIPGLAIPGIIIIGFTKVEYRFFFVYGILFDVFTESIFLLLGFYSGISLISFLKYLKLEQYTLLGLVLFAILFYFLYKKIKQITINKK